MNGISKTALDFKNRNQPEVTNIGSYIHCFKNSLNYHGNHFFFFFFEI